MTMRAGAALLGRVDYDDLPNVTKACDGGKIPREDYNIFSEGSAYAKHGDKPPTCPTCAILFDACLEQGGRS